MAAQTAREALIGELIGDVDTLLKRVDALGNALPDAAERSAARIEAAASRFKADIERDREAHLKALRQLAAEAKAAAWVVDGASRRFAALALLGGFGGGILGGALAGTLFAQWMLR
jgi:hypothetical protein